MDRTNCAGRSIEGDENPPRRWFPCLLEREVAVDEQIIAWLE
jgi:hypothetical protein